MIYQYDKKRYQINILLPSLLAMYFTIYNFIKILSKSGNILNFLGLVFCLIILIDFFVIDSHVKKIEITEQAILVYGFRKKTEFDKNDIERLLVKTFQNSKKVYLRIGKSQIGKGKYWIDYIQFNDCDLLMDSLYEIEENMHPMLNKFNKRSTRRKN